MNPSDTLWSNPEPNKHKNHLMHSNSLKAWNEIDMSKRERMVVDAFRAFGKMTDRQVRNRLGFDEMNSVRPRITALIDLGVLVEAGKVKCPTTGKTVRICKLTDKGRKAAA